MPHRYVFYNLVDNLVMKYSNKYLPNQRPYMTMYKRFFLNTIALIFRASDSNFRNCFEADNLVLLY